MSNTFFTYKDAKDKLTLKQKVGQLFMPAVFINDSEEQVQKMEELIRNNAIGAICFFHSRASAATNFEGKKKIVYNENSADRLRQLITRYQNASTFPLLVAIDAEWGLAMRVENTPQYPYAITLGAIEDTEDLVYEVGKNIGLDCKNMGIHWNLGPVVDINNNPRNPVIGYRSFGDHKEKVLAKAESYIKGMSTAGILNSLKHFPGHGDTETDSHLGLPIIHKTKQQLLKNELYPFKALIEHGVDSVMVGHLAVPSLDNSGNPATTSYPIITDLLRNELGFQGVIISDALNMHAVSKKYEQKGDLEAAAFNAGMDMMCFSEFPVEGIEQLLNSSTPERIEASFKRVWKLKEKVFQFQGSEEPSHGQDPAPLNKMLAESSLTQCYGNALVLKKIKEKGFLNLSVDNRSHNKFSAAIERHHGQEHHPVTLNNLDALRVEIIENDNVLLALFPPAVKPKNKFGFDQKILRFICDLITHKNTLIYLFGNPYVLETLNCIKNSNIVIVYQDFPEFQETAFEHFNGQLEAKGKLPIHLKAAHK